MRLLIHYIRAIGLCLSLCFTNLAVRAQDQTRGAKLSLHIGLVVAIHSNRHGYLPGRML
jgi:hypothetical protein